MIRAPEWVDRNFLRFVVVGGSNFLIGMLLFQLAWQAGAQLGAARTPSAQAFSYGIGMVWSFCWNRKWVFRSPDGPLTRVSGEALRFAISQIVCLLISTFLVTALIDGIGLPPLIGWLTAMAPLVLLNYYLVSRWVFASARPGSPALPTHHTMKDENV